MFSLLSLESLSKSKCLLNSSFVGARNRIESASEDGIIVGVDFGEGHDSFIALIILLCFILRHIEVHKPNQNYNYGVKPCKHEAGKRS